MAPPPPPAAGSPPDRDECVEQAYFFRTLRDRLADNAAAQEVLARLPDELLTTTRLPVAVGFLAGELKHSGSLAAGFAKLPHYFTPFQAFVVRQAEDDKTRLTVPEALVVLEREAAYKAAGPTPPGLFVYQFEAIARNRLGYDAGLTAVGGDPFYDADWRAYVELVRRQAGVIDFADLIYLRSDQYLTDRRRADPGYRPPLPPLFGDKEGRIAYASRGRDPLFLFAALQRQLGYPEVPKPRPADDLGAKLRGYEQKVRELDARVRILEAEQRGGFDPTQFGKPAALDDDQ